MKTAIFVSLLTSAAAFTPAAQQAKLSSTALAGAGGKAAFGGEIGAQIPLGFWDPLGFVEDGDQETFDRLRWVELKRKSIPESPCNWF